MFFEYLNNPGFNAKQVLSSFMKENFLEDNQSNLLKEAKNLKSNLLSKYFEFTDKEFNKYKKELKKEILDKQKEVAKEKLQTIIDSPLVDEYVNKFKNDCREKWSQGNDSLKLFLKFESIASTPEKPRGRYFLMPKQWFIESYESNVHYDRNSGKQEGKVLADIKYRFILKSIYGEIKTEPFIIEDIYSDLLELTDNDKGAKEYFFFYNDWNLILGIQNLSWMNEGIIRARLSIKESTVNFCFTNTPYMMMIEKDAFVLQQCKSGYDDINEELVVQIDEIEDEDEIKKIVQDDNRYQTEDEVKQMVKIRISERFEIIRNPDMKDSKLIKLKL